MIDATVLARQLLGNTDVRVEPVGRSRPAVGTLNLVRAAQLAVATMTTVIVTMTTVIAPVVNDMTSSVNSNVVASYDDASRVKADLNRVAFGGSGVSDVVLETTIMNHADRAGVGALAKELKTKFDIDISDVRAGASIAMNKKGEAVARCSIVLNPDGMAERLDRMSESGLSQHWGKRLLELHEAAHCASSDRDARNAHLAQEDPLANPIARGIAMNTISPELAGDANGYSVRYNESVADTFAATVLLAEGMPVSQVRAMAQARIAERAHFLDHGHDPSESTHDTSLALMGLADHWESKGASAPQGDRADPAVVAYAWELSHSITREKLNHIIENVLQDPTAEVVNAQPLEEATLAPSAKAEVTRSAAVRFMGMLKHKHEPATPVASSSLRPR